MGSIVGTIGAVVVCLALLLFLGTIIRLSVVGSIRARGERKRLRRPEFSSVEAKWGVRLPASMEAYFRSEIIRRSEFYLAPAGSKQSEWFYLGGFLPLTCRDISDWIAVTKVPGIPIALDASKGTYYLPFESLRQSSHVPVLLRLPGRERKDVKVASSFEEFSQFEQKAVPEEA